MADRVARLYQDYVEHSLLHYGGGSDDPHAALYDDALGSLQRIKKRLGGLKFQQMSELLSHATSLLREQNDSAGFYQFIEMLLTDYYDALYQHYQTKSEPRLVLSGNWSEITDWLESNQQSIQGHSAAASLAVSQQARL
jgi:tRNA 2-selenouridine synthase